MRFAVEFIFLHLQLMHSPTLTLLRYKKGTNHIPLSIFLAVSLTNVSLAKLFLNHKFETDDLSWNCSYFLLSFCCFIITLVYFECWTWFWFSLFIIWKQAINNIFCVVEAEIFIIKLWISVYTTLYILKRRLSPKFLVDWVWISWCKFNQQIGWKGIVTLLIEWNNRGGKDLKLSYVFAKGVNLKKGF